MPHNARRREVLRAVVDAAQERRDGHLPMDVPGVEDTFGDDVTLVAALQLRWHTQLAKRVEHAVDEVALETSSSAVDAVVAAWQDTAADLAGVRRSSTAARASRPTTRWHASSRRRCPRSTPCSPWPPD